MKFQKQTKDTHKQWLNKIGDEPSIIQLSLSLSNISTITKTKPIEIAIEIIIGNSITKYKEFKRKKVYLMEMRINPCRC